MRRSTTSTTDTRAAASGNSVTGPPQTPRAVRLRFGRTVLISLLAMASGVGLMAPPATAATSRQQIVTVATNQLGGTGCNPGYRDAGRCFARWGGFNNII